MFYYRAGLLRRCWFKLNDIIYMSRRVNDMEEFIEKNKDKFVLMCDRLFYLPNPNLISAFVRREEDCCGYVYWNGTFVLLDGWDFERYFTMCMKVGMVEVMMHVNDEVWQWKMEQQKKASCENPK